MPRKSLREFILGMKRNRVPQAIGSLFILDEDTDKVYACALGRGVIEYNDLSIDELREELKSGSIIITSAIKGDETVRIKGRLNAKLEDKWNKWISTEFNVDDSFFDFVTGRNDDDARPAPQIAAEALEVLKENDTWPTDEDDEDDGGW